LHLKQALLLRAEPWHCRDRPMNNLANKESIPALRQQAATLFRNLQDAIGTKLLSYESSVAFREDIWTREDSEHFHGGGGCSRVLAGGEVFERAGVNVSEVFGCLPSDMSMKLVGKSEPQEFYATGVSLVFHPESPMVPTTHANFRYLEVGDRAWFGGGMDLTPYYLFNEDAVHFHTVNKAVCDCFDPSYYPEFKAECDRYFYLPHRGETRGVGGIFFDYLGKEKPEQLETLLPFVEAAGQGFIDAYFPIVDRRKSDPYGKNEKEFQLQRRGRYVEFNLLHDRGTLFGLRTGGRIESILMSLPPLVKWEYDYKPEPGSREAELLDVLTSPRDWLAE
jgi:coproporphyrinogen III oxidase